MQVVGIDGYRGGWVAVVLDNGCFSAAHLFPDASAVLAAHADAEFVAADMPIGLPETGRRQADLAARQLLGPRRSSVFFAPPRDVLETEPYAAANALAKARHGFGISKQSYMLRPKILEIDAAMDAGSVVYEVHPEVAFRHMAATDLPGKKTFAGQAARRTLLEAHGVDLPGDIGRAGTAPADDVLDAAVVAWVAHRIGLGEAQSLPDPPDKDARGRPMAIWF